MGWRRTVGTIAGTVIGAAVGGPPGAAAGAKIGGELGGATEKKKGGKGGGGVAIPSSTHEAAFAPGPPLSASSLVMARGQDKARMKRSYGI